MNIIFKILLSTLFLINSASADYGHDMATKANAFTTKNNYIDAKYYLEEAANSDNKEAKKWAKKELGLMYFYGEGTEINYSKAKQYFTDTSDGGNVFAKGALGWMYLKGNGVPKDYSKAKQYFEEANSYNALGWMYYTEEPIKDYKKAKYYFEKAIEDGGTVSKSNLALMYFRGQGVAKDYKKAKSLFEEVSNEDFADPKNNLAWMYLNGYGIKQDINKALELFQEAAEKDNIAANLNLAWIYNIMA